MQIDPRKLAELLRRAADAHHEHERVHGPDPEWWHWYADYVVAQLGDPEPEPVRWPLHIPPCDAPGCF